MDFTTAKKPDIIPADETQPIIISPGSSPRETDKDAFELPPELPILAVRNQVTFPGTIVPLSIRRDKSRQLLASLLPDQKIIAALCQKDPEDDNPAPQDLYQVGTAMMVLKLLRMEDDTQNLIVQGLSRIRVVDWLATDPYLRARIEPVLEFAAQDQQTEALMMNVRTMARRVIELSPNVPDEALVVLNNIKPPGALADFLASNLEMELDHRQMLLEETDVSKRLRIISEDLQQQAEILELSHKIHNQVRANIDKTQRQYFLQEQLKAIRKELGQVDEKQAEMQALRERIVAANMPHPVQAEALLQVDRLVNIPNASPEYSVILTYLDVLIELPWNQSAEDLLDVKRARKILDEDHYDLEKVKRRILEYLAVRKLAPDSHGPILCFVGPPGVGKTSLGQSIARALGRKFIRMSLGGMHDEAELRGHRRTYVGAMPGRILQEIRKTGSNNPVFMLDELDKLGADFRGDPTSALLEILDPAQNNTFQDHYLNVPFDLSRVLFIGTANYMGTVPPALRDRMEVIELPGYTQREKRQIAKKYLVPRQCRENGLKPTQAKWNDAAITKILQDYTREAGVRELERQIGAVCRGVAAKIAAGTSRGRTITPRLVSDLLGPRLYENELAQRTAQPGVATGLAYTPVGGTILFVEATAYPGKGQLLLTGHIGEVMKESAQAALSLVKSIANKNHVDSRRTVPTDIHIHVPAGAVPKDGPSAGVAMFTALMSLMTDRTVKPDVAMTGEITLRGLVLPIGGVKEKVLAARQAGIHTVILPAGNRKDLIDIPEDAKKNLNFVFARHVNDVLASALDGESTKMRVSRRKKKTTAKKTTL
ncbi:MAG: endopeptidase La [Phycisphaerae bacterium]|nr:endopeptidase La [Phycisphaerae bacterium]